MTALLSELRRSWRTALRRPGFLALAGATLALGIGARAAVFALADAVLLAPPPFPQPLRLVVLGKRDAHPWSSISPQQYQMRDGVAGIERLGAKFAPKDVNVAGAGDPELVTAWPVDTGLLPTLGVTLAQVSDALLDLLRQFVPLNAAVRVDGESALREVNARQGVAGLRLFERDVADATAAERMNAVLIGTFAAAGAAQRLGPQDSMSHDLRFDPIRNRRDDRP